MNTHDSTDIFEPGLVSIITPVYNGAKYIAETIESVLGQTYTKWEMIIIDDGSTDNSAEIVKRYLEKDKRLLFFQQKNAGSSGARNNGIRRARGQYITLLDADDVFEPNCLESQIRFMKEKDAIYVYASVKRINEQSLEILKATKVRRIVTYKQMLVTDHVQTLTSLYDRTKFGKIYLHEELKSLRDDYAYSLDIVKLAGFAYGNPEILARFRIFASSTTGKKVKLVKVQYNFYRKYLGFSSIRSVLHTCYWAIRGIFRYTKLFSGI